MFDKKDGKEVLDEIDNLYKYLMNKIIPMYHSCRRFIKFELHLDDIKQDMDDTRSTLGQIEKDIKDVDRSIQGLM